MKLPTGGIVREPRKRLIRCDSGTDSIVWMREEIVRLKLAAVFSAKDLTAPRMDREHPGVFIFGILNGFFRAEDCRYRIYDAWTFHEQEEQQHDSSMR